MSGWLRQGSEMRCVIDVVTGNTFVAISEATGEPLEFCRDEIAPEDLDRIRPGARFEWTCGYQSEPWGQKSQIAWLPFVSANE